jgi:hypothetical protein
MVDFIFCNIKLSALIPKLTLGASFRINGKLFNQMMHLIMNITSQLC